MPRLLAALALAGAARRPPRPRRRPRLCRPRSSSARCPLGKAGLSPDGRHAGAVVTDKADMRDLLIYDLATYKPTGLRGSGSLEISTFRWIDDRRLIFSLAKDKIYTWGLYSATVDHLERFTPIDRFDVTQVVGVPQSRPDRVLVWIRQSAKDDNRPGPAARARRRPHAERLRRGAGVERDGALLHDARERARGERGMERDGALLQAAPGRPGAVLGHGPGGRPRPLHDARRGQGAAPPLRAGDRHLAGRRRFPPGPAPWPWTPTGAASGSSCTRMRGAMSCGASTPARAPSRRRSSPTRRTTSGRGASSSPRAGTAWRG